MTYQNSSYFYMVDSAFRSTCDVLDVEGKVVQLNDYYPFGLPYSDTGSMKGTDIQPYKYNGKEFQTMHGLHWYDYGARMYDPIICRWNAVDPLAEKYYNVTPYSYCLNNPVNAIDPDGRFPYKWQAKLSRGSIISFIKQMRVLYMKIEKHRIQDIAILIIHLVP
ncbi:RHS repeat domain-containing protein [Prevotella histicola]